MNSSDRVAAKVVGSRTLSFIDSPSGRIGDTFGTVMVQQAESVAPRKARGPIVRGTFFVLGLISLALLPLSFLPGIPTFDLVILAAFFFSMSSDKMYGWMINHRYFGRIIRGYRDYGLTMRMKWAASVGIAVSLLVSGVFLVDFWWLRVVLVVVGVYALWFVFSRPTRDPGVLV